MSEQRKPLVSHIFTADPSAHVFNGKIYVYPSHDIPHDGEDNDDGDEYRMEDYHVLSMDNPDAQVIRSKKRRRIRMGELFSDNGDDFYDFDAPQHLIDSQKAYYQPVYPRGWKGNGSDQQHE